MKHSLLLSICLLLLGTVNAVSAPPQPFTAGNLVILRYGDGTTAPVDGSQVALFLDEYTTAGVLVQSIALPTATIGDQRSLTGTYNDGYEGALSRSVDGAYITLTGYEATPSVASTTGLPRVIGRIGAAADVNTTTAFNADILKDPRSAATVDGTKFWVCGGSGGVDIGGGIGGVRVLSLGANKGSVTMTDHGDRLGGAKTSYSTYIFKKNTFGQLYYTGSNAVRTLGIGIPESGSQDPPELPGFTSGNRPDPLQVIMFDTDNDDEPDLMYIANNGNKNSLGQITKYALVSGTWVHKGGVASTQKTENMKFLTAELTGGVATIYCVSHGNSATSTPSALYKITNTIADDLANTDFNTTPIVTAPANTMFRGVAFAPVATTNPVSLSSFTAAKDNEKVTLSWETKSESNNDYFEVLRSADKDNFVAIGTVSGKGNEGGSYRFIDYNPLNGVNYYQLKQFDKDGTEESLGVKAIDFALNTGTTLQIYPNPSSGEFNIALPSPVEKLRELIVFDTYGKKIYSQHIQKGQRHVHIVLPAKPQPGMYIVQIESMGVSKLQLK